MRLLNPRGSDLSDKPKSRWLLVIFVFVGIVLITVTAYCIFRGRTVSVYEAHYPVSKVIQYRVSVRNNANQYREKPTLSLVLPLAKTSSQRVQEFQVSAPYSVHSGPGESRIAHLELDGLAPYAARELTVRVMLTMAAEPNKQPLVSAENFLSPEAYIESSDPQIQKMAARLKRRTPQDSARAIYDYVLNHLNYAGYIQSPQGALWALKNRRGDCTEYAQLVTALARAQGIPARVVSGFVVAGNATLKAENLHNWAELYIDEAWQIVDAQKRQFFTHSADYVAFSLINPALNDGLMTHPDQLLNASTGLDAVLH